MSGYNSFKFANWPKSLESHSLMQINYPKIYLIAGFFGGARISFWPILVIFDNPPKLKSPNISPLL